MQLATTLAEGVGFEPTCRLITDNSISSRARYDHFDSPPYSVLTLRNRLNFEG